MIRDFWVENFFSISKRQEMNFEVRKEEDEWMRVEVSPGVYIGKLAVIYGANASGKSNMLKALQEVFTLLFTSRTDRNQSVSSGEPFALTPDKPTRMYVSFFANDIRFDYTIVYDKIHIITELQEYNPNGLSRCSMKGHTMERIARPPSNLDLA
jgi:AAA15 family ATPase/GTPase